ncbi:PREDICTED: uncharacterized protein LOC104602979 isoform X1 [Nelumbo nucifera]|uniref:Uncharacterized protein LOC104602979 isoform X1 n=1 Tax=Nelumbo nucifera TaxID=4432 RepID=A0A1U8ADZ4_NELNU|nr:PREDICTED: uncharacterized protein LOC104602979 isoform X1 [Nelumbo nucifera]XP_019053581.1 PREDICTED: uncharacterized protein LOC104602979 isoform X1 [Nelumbo nucifera]
MRSDQFSHHHYSASDGFGSYFSSPSDSFQTQQWTPPPVQRASADDYVTVTLREPTSGPLTFTPLMEGSSAIPYSAGSTSSRSDGSEYEPITKTHASSHRRYSFMSKPVHPLSFPTLTLGREADGAIAPGNCVNQPTVHENSMSHHSDLKYAQNLAELHSASGFPEFGATTPQREALQWSSASSSIDFTDASEQLDSECFAPSCNPQEGFKCGLCDRFLSQRSPWSSRRIVRSGDMPVAGVLSCRHVFHAECLEQTTPKTQKHDPPCPLCARLEENVPEQRLVSRLKNGLPRLRPFCEDGPSRSWGCGQVGDCVEGALHGPPRNAMLLLNRSRLKKHLSMKGSSSKEIPEKLKKSGSYVLSNSVDQGAVGCSRTAGLTLKRW